MNFLEKFGRSAMELKTLRCITVTGILIALDLVLKLFSIKITNDLKITFAYIALATIGMLFGPTVGFLAGVLTDLIGFMISPEGGFSPLFTIVEAFGAMLYGIFLYDLKPLRIGSSFVRNDEKRTTGKNILISLGIGLLICGLFMGISYLITQYMAGLTQEEGVTGKVAKVLSDPLIVYVAGCMGLLYGTFFSVIIISGRDDKTELKKSFAVIISKVMVVIICNLIMTPLAMVISGYMTWDAMVAAYPVRFIKNAIQCPVDCLILLIVLFPILAAYKKIFPKAALNNKKSTESDVTND